MILNLLPNNCSKVLSSGEDESTTTTRRIMDTNYVRTIRSRHDAVNDGGRPRSRNKIWAAGEGGSRSGTSTPHHPDSERWERGGHRGGGRGSRGARGLRGGRGVPKFSNVSLRLAPPKNPSPVDVEEMHGDDAHEAEHEIDVEEEQEEAGVIHEPELETQEEREQFYQEVRSSVYRAARTYCTVCSW